MRSLCASQCHPGTARILVERGEVLRISRCAIVGTGLYTQWDVLVLGSGEPETSVMEVRLNVSGVWWCGDLP